MLRITEQELLETGTYEKYSDTELGNYEISGTGDLQIRNTGGSSASEGGMGTGGGPEKGPGITNPAPGTKETSQSGEQERNDEGWDPLKPAEEKEKLKD